MLWGKRILTWFLAIVLVFSLFGLALGTSLDLTFRDSSHLKSWAENSNFYTGLLNKAESDTTTSLGSSSLATQLDPVVRQSLESVFPETEFNQDINTIINGNYAWLEGKTSVPKFNIDISKEKIAFANALGTYAETKYENLPICTKAQLVSLTDTNPLSLTCKVPTISGSVTKMTVVNEVEATNIIVKNTIITPDTLSTTSGKPYYKDFNVSKAYKHLKYAPIALGLICLICFMGVAFFSPRKRHAVKLLGSVLGLVGLVLLILSISTTRASNRLDSSVARHVNLGSFNTATDNLIHKIVSHVNSINLWFAIFYLLISCAVLSLLLLKRRRHIKNMQKDNEEVKLEKPEVIRNADRPSQPIHHAKIQPTAPELKHTPKLKHTPNKKRLIQ